MKNRVYDIIVMGGGHAGLEAAHFGSLFKLDVAIVTLKNVPLASAPCNPSIGGVGKGQVVKEIDSLGGIMGVLADKSGIQYRTLNDSKGYAVQSTRVQIDKDHYSMEAESYVSSNEFISLIRDKVVGVSKEQELYKVSCDDGVYYSRKLIVTVGTFLNGKLHLGSSVTSGGRMNTNPSSGFNSIFKDIKTNVARFKTGTPPRIRKEGICFDKMQEQASDPNTLNFHIFSEGSPRQMEQKSCYLTYTNEETVEIIKENKELSPMYNGQIDSVGARYCPSIEDKVYRYPEKSVHHIFVEPEGLDLDTYYPSGISSSLPENVQQSFIQTVKGLESAKIKHFGYAVEYDVLDTCDLNLCLEHNSSDGLYFAGQVNGTSGYEEAAGQGLIAGINASLSIVGKKPFILNRFDSYIGVMVEDLVSNTRDEPYRLFTARAENRLNLREDNSFVRMRKYRLHLDLNSDFDKKIKSLIDQKNFLEQFIDDFIINSDIMSKIQSLSKRPELLGRKLSIKAALNLSFIDPVITLIEILALFDFNFPLSVIRNVAISAKYEKYIDKSKIEVTKMALKDEKKISYERLLESENISFECKQRISKIKPETYGQLKRMNGIRKVTLAIVSSGKY